MSDKFKQYRDAYAKFAKDYSDFSESLISEEIDVLLAAPQPNSPRSEEMLKQEIKVLEAREAAADLEKRQLEIVGPILLDVITDISALSKNIQERAIACQGEFIMNDSMIEQGQRLLRQLSQLENCFGNKSPFGGHKKEIITKIIRDFSEKVADIFELSVPARTRT